MATSISPETDYLKHDVRNEYQSRLHLGSTLHHLQRLFWADFGPAHVPVRKDIDVVAANFPDVDTKILSPAFTWLESVPAAFKRGQKSPTDQDTLERFVRQISLHQSWMQVHRTSFQSGEGHHFTYMTLSARPKGPNDSFRSREKLRLWIQSGVHGNEPAGDQSVLALLGKLDSDPSWAIHVLDSIDILVFPCYNADGVVDFNRPCTMGIDLNRDHVRLKAPESKGIRKLFCEFRPHIAIDMHEYGAKARFGKYTHGSDLMFSAAKNLNIHPAIRELSERQLAVEVGRRLDQSPFRWEPYVPTTGSKIFFREAGSDGKIGRNAMGLTQCISFLCETRGIGIADQHFHRRTAAGLAFLESVLEIAAKNAETIYRTVEYASHQFIKGTSDITIKDTATKIDRTFTMIDTETGDLLKLPIQFASTTPTTPILVRSRPEAYSIPSSLCSVAELLIDSGLEVQELEDDWTGQAEVLVVKTAELGTTYFEGVVPMTVTTTCTCKEVSLPQGTRLVSTRQRNAALAFIALEPENVDSYVSSNIIPVIPGDEYPVFRLMTDP